MHSEDARHASFQRQQQELDRQHEAKMQRIRRDRAAIQSAIDNVLAGARAGSGSGAFGNGAASSGSSFAGTSGSCKARQDAITSRLTQSKNAPSGGICASARVMHDAFVEAASFYAQCPSADPSGEMRKWANENINITQQQMRGSCAN